MASAASMLVTNEMWKGQRASKPWSNCHNNRRRKRSTAAAQKKADGTAAEEAADGTADGAAEKRKLQMDQQSWKKIEETVDGATF